MFIALFFTQVNTGQTDRRTDTPDTQTDRQTEEEEFIFRRKKESDKQ